MNTKDQGEKTMSFSHWALVCEGILERKGLPQTWSGQAWMRPQSKGDPVLGLHSCRALSPVPRPKHGTAARICHLQT